ncbi:hypothetical protein CTI12_AA233910 [Artemisia annua]|uniref:C2 domain-containing protein n=1 Tax=Artemisia annua TaxID=35608 RepID=A0A2U1NS02_ARTAN|nr:hypothetical protein CTI12_AA233910 [Artemisia annua]
MKTKDGRASTDAYSVTKFGTKWIKKRTIVDSFAQKWNEQYMWEVFYPCTVISIGVFDNCHLHGGDKAEGAKDSKIGKSAYLGFEVRKSQPLTKLKQISGVRKQVLNQSGRERKSEGDDVFCSRRKSVIDFLYKMKRSTDLPMLDGQKMKVKELIEEAGKKRSLLLKSLPLDVVIIRPLLKNIPQLQLSSKL